MASTKRWIVIGGVVVGLGLAGALVRRLHADEDPPIDGEVPSARPSLESLATSTPELDLAITPSGAEDPELDEAAVAVVVTKKQLLVAGDDDPIAVFPGGVASLGAAGLPERYKWNGPNDLLLTELGQSLSFWRRPSAASGSKDRLALLADRSTPYRVLVEIMFTAGQSELGRFDFAVRHPDGRLAWMSSRPPRVTGLRSGLGGFALNAFVVDGGIAIKASSGNVAPGCHDVGAGLAIPKAGAAHDFPAFTACLRKIKNEVPAAKDETSITLTASPAVDLQTVISLMNAAEGAPNDPLFPDVHFGVAK